MTDAERATTLKAKGWVAFVRNDGLHAVRDSSGHQIGTGENPDAAVAAALAVGQPERAVGASPKGKGTDE